LVLGDRFQATNLKASFISTREVNLLCDAFQSDVPRVGKKRSPARRARRQLRSALLTDTVPILTQKYRRCHVLHTNWALQGAEDVLTQTVSENTIIWIVVVQLYEVI
jgi:hypothetical protein